MEIESLKLCETRLPTGELCQLTLGHDCDHSADPRVEFTHESFFVVTTPDVDEVEEKP